MTLHIELLYANYTQSVKSDRLTSMREREATEVSGAHECAKELLTTCTSISSKVLSAKFESSCIKLWPVGTAQVSTVVTARWSFLHNIL